MKQLGSPLHVGYAEQNEGKARVDMCKKLSGLARPRPQLKPLFFSRLSCVISPLRAAQSHGISSHASSQAKKTLGACENTHLTWGDRQLCLGLQVQHKSCWNPTFISHAPQFRVAPALHVMRRPICAALRTQRRGSIHFVTLRALLPHRSSAFFHTRTIMAARP